MWDISSDLELEYGTIVSPTVIPYEEFERYKNDLPYYKNIQSEGVGIIAWYKERLALDGQDFSKHAGVISYFQKEYVKSGKFNKKYSQYISQAFQIRNNSDL